ncbi:MAG: hypothetical protein P8Z67_06545 [Gammaproteobacteria bacterium]
MLAVSLASAFCAGARILLWRMHPDIPGPGRWALAGVSGAIALLLLMLFDAYPLPFSLAIAQLLAAVGLILAWDGFRRFHGQSPLTLRTLAMLVASVLAWLVLVTVSSTDVPSGKGMSPKALTRL